MKLKEGLIFKNYCGCIEKTGKKLNRDNDGANFHVITIVMCNVCIENHVFPNWKSLGKLPGVKPISEKEIKIYQLKQ